MKKSEIKITKHGTTDLETLKIKDREDNRLMKVLEKNEDYLESENKKSKGKVAKQVCQDNNIIFIRKKNTKNNQKTVLNKKMVSGIFRARSLDEDVTSLTDANLGQLESEVKKSYLKSLNYECIGDRFRIFGMIK